MSSVDDSKNSQGLVRPTSERSVSLENLDWQRIDRFLAEEQKSQVPSWERLAWFVSVAGVALLIWLPSTLWYRRMADDPWLILGFTCAALSVGTGLGRLLMRAAERARQRQAEQAAEQSEPYVPPTWLRPALAVVLVAGLVFLVGVFPRTTLARTSLGAMIPMLGSIGLGIVFMRWLLLPRAAIASSEIPPFEWPWWTRWVVLGLLVTGAFFSATASWFSAAARQGDSSVFDLIGIVTGLGFAAWLARSVDRAYEEARKKSEYSDTP